MLSWLVIAEVANLSETAPVVSTILQYLVNSNCILLVNSNCMLLVNSKVYLHGIPSKVEVQSQVSLGTVS